MNFRFDDFELNAESLELTRGRQPVRADRLVLRLLAVLIEQAGELVTKQTLVSRVWGDRAVSENVITVAMTRLRKTLGHEQGEREFVANVHGRGYRFVRAVTVVAVAPPAVAPLSLRGLPFVGREPELDSLHGALTLAKDGQGAVAVLLGEAGIGKTSVAEMLVANAVTSGFAVSWGYCREAGHTPPLWPFVQVVRGLRDRARVDWDEPRLHAALSELRRALPELDAALVDATKDSASPGSPPANHRLFDGLARVIWLVGEQTPCLIVLDDLQSADSASLEVLRYLTGEIARARVLVVGTLRKGVTPEAPGDRHLSHVLGHRNATRLELPRLAASDVSRYVSAAVSDPGGATAQAVFSRSEGNPFFMAELVRLLKSKSPQDASSLAVPSAALDLLRQRVDGLGAAARDILSIASVIGNEFDLSLLERISGVGAMDLMTSLDAAAPAEIALPASDSKTSFRFSHELLRAVLYDDLEKQRRRQLHQRVVLALERSAVEGRPPAPSELAYHAYAALPEGDPRKTVGYCSDAADAAASLRAHADAARYLRHALAALDLVPAPSPRFRLRLLLRQALCARACTSPEFEPVVREAIRLARAQGSANALAQAALLLDLHPGFPAFSGARAALEEARRGLSPTDDMLGAVLGRLAISAPSAYDVKSSSEHLARGVELAEGVELTQGSGSLLCTYTVQAARLYSRGGPLHEADAESALAILEDLCKKNPGILSVTPALLELHRAIRGAQRGELPGAAAAVDACTAYCKKLGHHELSWHAERFRLLLRVNRGQIDGLEADLRSHHQWGRRDAIVGREAFIAYDESVVLQMPTRLDIAEQAIALAFHEDDPPSIWSLKLRALAASNRSEEARRALRQIPIAALASLPCDRDYLGTLGALARAAVTLRELGYAEAVAELLRPFENAFCVNVAFLCEGSVIHVLGSIENALGRRLHAAELLRAGADVDEQAGFLRCAQQARLELRRPTGISAESR